MASPAEPIVAAVTALRNGGLVVLPTETVYGLAADALNVRAVARVYAVKGRPADHPLILHVARAEALERWAGAIPDYARRLAARAWPGPLTLVLPRSHEVGDHVTGGQDSVAIRVPDHPVALAVLRAFGSAVAAPSANRFGHVSPTTVAHVEADLGRWLDPARDVVLEGGSCRVGVESTIVDCTGAAPGILRPGWFDDAAIAELAGCAVAGPQVAAPRVPGSTSSHYAPRAAVHVATEGELPELADSGATDTGLLALASTPLPPGWVRLADPVDADQYARVLYGALREADALGLDRIVAVPPESAGGVSIAIGDRLRRAGAGA